MWAGISTLPSFNIVRDIPGPSVGLEGEAVADADPDADSDEEEEEELWDDEILEC